MRRSITEEQLAAAQASPEEFQVAVAHLADQPDGTQLSQGTQSYIKLEGQVYQVTNFSLGEGSYKYAKVAYNQAGDRFAIKFSREKNRHLASEQQIESELNLFRGAARRTIIQEDGTSATEDVGLMPYLGKNLANYLKFYRFTPQQVVNIILQAVDEVLALHKQGYFHCDIKPGNFVLDRSKAKLSLIDFGFSVRIPKDGMYRRQEALGTRGYAAPEISRGEYSEKTETYALGVSILEMIRFFGVNLPAIESLAAAMMCFDKTERPNLEDVKTALVVYQHSHVSLEQLADILQENDCLVVDSELAVRQAVMLFNATKTNHFSNSENFQRLVEHHKIKYLVFIIWKYPEFRELLFSDLSNVRRIDDLYFSFEKVESEGKLTDKMVQALLRYPDFSKLIREKPCDFHELLTRVTWDNDLDLLRELMANPRISYRHFQKGDSPVMIAVKNNNLPMLEYLLSDENPQRDQVIGHSDSLRALDWAMQHGRWRAVTVLIMANLGDPDRKYQAVCGLVQSGSAALLLRLIAHDPALLNETYPDVNKVPSSLLRIYLLEQDFMMVAYLLLYDVDLDSESLQIFKEHKSKILNAICNLLRSFKEESIAQEKAVNLLNRMGIPKHVGMDRRLHLALFEKPRCFCLFKSPDADVIAELKGLAKGLDAPQSDFVAVQPGASSGPAK